MEGIREREDHKNRWAGKVKEDLKVMEKRYWDTVAGGSEVQKGIVLAAKGHNGLWCLRRKRR